jgi:hypothetical protein
LKFLPLGIQIRGFRDGFGGTSRACRIAPVPFKDFFATGGLLGEIAGRPAVDSHSEMSRAVIADFTAVSPSLDGVDVE